jgi:hypothetical protein
VRALPPLPESGIAKSAMIEFHPQCVPAFVYFLKTIPYRPRDMVYVKIGHAIDPFTRKIEIDTGCPFETKIAASVICENSEQAVNLEHVIHTYLRQDWLRGEWFKGSPKVERMIQCAITGTLRFDWVIGLL